jgi:hypothetical protein
MVTVALAIFVPVGCCCVSYRAMRFLTHRERATVPAGGELMHAPSRLERLMMGRPPAPIVAFESRPHADAEREKVCATPGARWVNER